MSRGLTFATLSPAQTIDFLVTLLLGGFQEIIARIHKKVAFRVCSWLEFRVAELAQRRC